MFETLTSRLGDVFARLRKRALLNESDVSVALREIRLALLEADVALSVVKSFIEEVRSQAISEKVLRSITPGQQVTKIVYDHLVKLLGGEGSGLILQAPPPLSILLIGLQGSGKTTTTAKLGLYLSQQYRKKVLMASLDVRRPAAREQLRILGEQVQLATVPITPDLSEPTSIAKYALQLAGGYDIVLFDSAGRLTIDESASAELVALQELIRPSETLLVADAMTGQDAATVATGFKSMVSLTGIVLTRMDSDARGGAALSMRQLTGQPIKFIGVGEKLEALESFYPDRIASRILGLGDVVSLVEKASAAATQQELDRLEQQDLKSQFTLDDLLSQLRQLRQLGGVSEVLRLLPTQLHSSVAKGQGQIDERSLRCQEAIILSMTKAERRDIRILNGSRRRRIAKGSGVTVPDVNRLIKQFHEMQTMMKKMKKLKPHALEQMLGKIGKFRQRTVKP